MDVNWPFNCGLLSSCHSFFLSSGTPVAIAPSELVGVAETERPRFGETIA